MGSQGIAWVEDVLLASLMETLIWYLLAEWEGGLTKLSDNTFALERVAPPALAMKPGSYIPGAF